MTAAYYLIPVSGGGPVARVVLYNLVSVSSAVAIAVRFGSCRGTRAWLPWLLLGLSQAIYAGADITFYVSHYLLQSTRFPSLSDVLYLGHYPFLVTALVLLFRRRNPGRDLPGLLDAAMLAVTAALLSWLFLIGPQARAELTLLVRAATLAYPVMDLAVLAVSLRLVLGRGRRPPALVLLAGSLFAIFAADALYGLQQLDGSYRIGGALDAVWLSGNLALGAAALHPTAHRLDEVTGAGEAGFGPVRMAAVTAAGLTGPVLLLVNSEGHTPGGLAATACAWAVLFMLIILRMHGLVLEQRRIAVTDELTGLYTRRWFQARLAAETARVRRGDAELAVFMVDVDHFKRINDRYGHPAGDRALAEIATRLRASAGPDDLLARYGGEEFALLMTVPADRLAGICERLRHRVAAEPIRVVDGVDVAVTVSIGVASTALHGAAPEHLVTVADNALYRAKAGGRDRAVIGCRAGRSDHAGALTETAVATAVAGTVATAVVRQPAVARQPTVDFLRLAADHVDRCLSAHEHSRPVGQWARMLALELGYGEDAALRAELAGRLHDVGKIVIPARLLGKPGALSDEEWRVLREHPDQGARLVRLIPGLEGIAEIVRQHHERFDGTGYPRRLAGAAIVPEARILAVCDSWAAMRSDRSYQGAMAVEQAAEELRRGRGSQYDPPTVDAFLDLYGRGRLGELPEIGAGPATRAPQPAPA